jgi:L-fucose isomerase
MKIKSEKARVGFITFGDHRPDMWEKVFSHKTLPLHEKAMELVRGMDVEVVTVDKVCRTREQINEGIDSLKGQDIDVLVAHIPCWTSPNLVVHGIQRMGIFTVLLGNRDPGTHGCVGLLGAAGSLGQIDFPHRCIRENYEASVYTEKVLPLIKAVSVKEKLKGSVLGLFGGRSIGIDTSQFDPMQWKAKFGIDSEHIDQIEIVRLAEKIPAERIDTMRTWIEKNAKSVNYNDDKLTREKFDFQLACYLATKDMVD